MNHAIEYINKNGPYDGVLGFSQGTLICRLLLKNKELLDYATPLKYPLKFGVLFSGPSYFHLNPFVDNPDDYNILHTKYEQPICYIYGTNDPLIAYLKRCVVKEGDYVEVIHDGKHKIPRLFDEDIIPLLEFMSKQYFRKCKTKIKLAKPIDENYHNKYFQILNSPLRSKL